MKFILLSSIMAITFCSCKKDKPQVPVLVPDNKVSYEITDTMRLNTTVQNLDLTFYNDYNGKVYNVNGGKGKVSFTISGNDMLLSFKDSAVQNFASAALITLYNKSATNITGTYNVNSTNSCVKVSQDLGTNSWIQSGGCEDAAGTITLTYDAATNTINGSITKLQVPFSVFMPYIIAGRGYSLSYGGWLKADGSKRYISMNFSNARILP